MFDLKLPVDKNYGEFRITTCQMLLKLGTFKEQTVKRHLLLDGLKVIRNIEDCVLLLLSPDNT